MSRAPSFDPANRNPRVGPAQLPAEGRKGPAPSWPLAGRMRAGELDAWRKLWKSPQAVQWERMGAATTRVIARYCRVLVAAEAGLDATLLAEARQLEDRLGLTPKTMRLMLWTIVGDTPSSAAQQEAASRGRGATVTDIQQRIPAVEG